MSPILGHKRQSFTETQNQIQMDRFQANKYKYMTKRKRHERAISWNTEEERIDSLFFNMRKIKAAVGKPSQSE